jgi:hypothetical protein
MQILSLKRRLVGSKAKMVVLLARATPLSPVMPASSMDN